MIADFLNAVKANLASATGSRRLREEMCAQRELVLQSQEVTDSTVFRPGSQARPARTLGMPDRWRRLQIAGVHRQGRLPHRSPGAPKKRNASYPFVRALAVLE